ncbi:motile sperm domain-containing [Lynx pardinus]|uniref:Motile sperm domain-containing n=1 Tax=Lynx pardinus TaxID=191816 RepID=A0A485PFP1_LYNPA|nr:motile sperm domain-containing [Lynx pardinus]
MVCVVSKRPFVSPFQCHTQNKAKLVSETRRRFEADYVTDKSDKYDPRDVERLQQDDNWVESYLLWRHNNVDETLKMLDESFQWRKEMSVNALATACPSHSALSGLRLPALTGLRVKYHIKDHKTTLDKKKLIAFWLERYAKRENGKPVTVMFDLSETGINSIDMDFVRFIINCFKVYYPKYLSKMVIFDMPWIMNAAFKIVKSWLGPEAVSLLKFASKNEVQDYVSVEYLPPHMGGTDPFKYSYPPLVDDDFQTPLCENGPIASEDEASSKEDLESDGKETLETISSEEQTALLKKINITEHTSKAEENEKVDSKMKAFKKPLSVFKGPLLHISPAEELYFGSTESGEKKTLIVLTNVTKNIVAFKVRTTAPEKYRVKPSNSSCDPGASVDIVVSPHGGLTVSAQDRFLIMAAEMEQSSGTGPAELTQFWKEVPRNKVMEHRLRCHIVESSKPTTLTLKDNAFNMSDKTSEDLYLQFANSSRESDFSTP